MLKINKLAALFRKESQDIKDVTVLSGLLAALRAASHIHQTHHWQTHNSQYYGDHLLFERLYNDGQENIDSIAERSIGVGQNISYVDGMSQISSMQEFVQKAYQVTSGNTPDDMVKRSLAIENTVLKIINESLEHLESTNNLTDGTRNLLEDIADNRESFLYLLQQRARS